METTPGIIYLDDLLQTYGFRVIRRTYQISSKQWLHVHLLTSEESGVNATGCKITRRREGMVVVVDGRVGDAATAAGKNATERIRRKSCSEVVIQG